MSVVPETIFNPLSSQYYGVGTTARLLLGNYDTNIAEIFPVTQGTIRIQASVIDIDTSFLGLNNSVADSLWANAASQIPYTQSLMNTSNFSVILNVAIPDSWLTSGSLSSTLALDSYAILAVAGFNYFNSFTNLLGLEVCSSPENVTNHISALNVVYLAEKITSVATSRTLSINLIGPSISQVPPLDSIVVDQNASYLNVSVNSTFQYYSINGFENITDVATVNAATFSSRTYMSAQLLRATTSANSSRLYCLPKIIPTLSTIASVFPGVPTLISETTPSDYPAYSIRLGENFIGALNAGFGTVLFDKLTYDPNSGTDQHCIYNPSFIKRPTYELLQFLNTLPLNGAIYQAETLNTLDQTLKAVIVNSDSMGFSCIMARPLTDSFNGQVNIKIKNPIWSSAYEFSNFTFSVFPSTVNISAASVTFSQITDDVCTGSIGFVKIDNLPVNCIVILQATITLVPPVNVPVPIPPNVLLETIVQMFVFNGIPTTGTIVPGSIYFDLATNVTMVYDSALGWIPAVFYTGL